MNLAELFVLSQSSSPLTPRSLVTWFKRVKPTSVAKVPLVIANLIPCATAFWPYLATNVFTKLAAAPVASAPPAIPALISAIIGLLVIKTEMIVIAASFTILPVAFASITFSVKSSGTKSVLYISLYWVLYSSWISSKDFPPNTASFIFWVSV